MTYRRRIDRLNPGLIIVLVDQSDSMAELIDGGRVSKAQAVADQINTLLYELILRCVKTPREPPRAYFYVSVIGYSTAGDGESIVEPALTIASSDGAISTTDLAASPLRVESRTGPHGGAINAPSGSSRSAEAARRCAVRLTEPGGWLPHGLPSPCPPSPRRRQP